MTRKHFQMIANVVAALPESVREEAALAFAAELWAYNTNFDRARFLRACNI